MKMKSNLLKPKISFLCIVLILLSGELVYPQEEEITKFPNRPITYIITVPPGGPTDLANRLLAKEAEKYLKQPIAIVNKSGGGLTIGTAAIALAKPDGYTIGLFGAGSAILVPLVEKVPYHPIKDLTPIAGSITLTYFGVSVRSDSPFNSFKDLIAYARQNPKKLTYGTTGIGSYGWLAMEKIAKIENVEFNCMPFKGTPEMEVALLGGHIPFGVGDFSYSLLEAKQIKPLLFLLDVHVAPEYREVPIVKDLYDGIPGLGRTGVGGPKGIPVGIVKKLEDAFIKAHKEPSFIEGVRKLHMEVIPHNAKEMSDYLVHVYEVYGKWVKEMGLVK